jgi:hypothetical protein
MEQSGHESRPDDEQRDPHEAAAGGPAAALILATASAADRAALERTRALQKLTGSVPARNPSVGAAVGVSDGD